MHFMLCEDVAAFVVLCAVCVAFGGVLSARLVDESHAYGVVVAVEWWVQSATAHGMRQHAVCVCMKSSVIILLPAFPAGMYSS